MAEHICPIHHVPFKRYEKGDNVWYAHKQDNGWCNEEKVKKEEIESTLTKSEPKQHRDYEAEHKQMQADIKENILLKDKLQWEHDCFLEIGSAIRAGTIGKEKSEDLALRIWYVLKMQEKTGVIIRKQETKSKTELPYEKIPY